MAVSAHDSTQTRASQPARLPSDTVLLFVLAAALTVFAAVALLVHWRFTNGLDRAGIDLLGSAKGSSAAHVAAAFTTLGDAAPLLTILIIGGVLVPVHWGGGWRLLALPAVSAGLGFAAATGVKQLTARARPPSAGWADAVSGYSFPSGHATSATAGYLVLAVLVSGLMRTARRRVAVLSAGIAIAFLVGASRVVLAVHWPTDVIAGWALGSAVAALTLVATRDRGAGVPRQPTTYEGGP